jgi:hypothetical protein
MASDIMFQNRCKSILEKCVQKEHDLAISREEGKGCQDTYETKGKAKLKQLTIQMDGHDKRIKWNARVELGLQ